MGTGHVNTGLNNCGPVYIFIGAAERRGIKGFRAKVLEKIWMRVFERKTNEISGVLLFLDCYPG